LYGYTPEKKAYSSKRREKISFLIYKSTQEATNIRNKGEKNYE